MFAEAGLGPVPDRPAISPEGNASDATARLAADFVARTNIDALNITALNPAERTISVAQYDSVIPRLREHVRVPLVLQLDSPITKQDLQRSVRAGIVKVQVGSEIDVAFSDALRRSLRSDRTLDPRSYLAEVRSALTETTIGIIEALTCRQPSGASSQA